MTESSSVIAWEQGRVAWVQGFVKGMRKLLGAMEIFVIVSVVIMLQVYTNVNILLKYM